VEVSTVRGRRWVGGHRIGPYKRRWSSLYGLLLTQRTGGLVRQARKRFGLAEALASGWLRWHDRLATGSGVVGPQPVEHEEEPHQCHEPELVEKEGWYHGNAPADDGEMRALYWILGLMELSAVERYTTFFFSSLKNELHFSDNAGA
jgi:hypothetical protein